MFTLTEGKGGTHFIELHLYYYQHKILFPLQYQNSNFTFPSLNNPKFKNEI